MKSVETLKNKADLKRQTRRLEVEAAAERAGKRHDMLLARRGYRPSGLT